MIRNKLFRISWVKDMFFKKTKKNLDKSYLICMTNHKLYFIFCSLAECLIGFRNTTMSRW